MSKKLTRTVAITLLLALSAASIIKLLMIRERYGIMAREDSDLMRPMSLAVVEYRDTHGKWPTSLEDLSRKEMYSDFVASDYFRRGKLVWNDGNWRLDNKGRPICWFLSDKHWFYVAVMVENGNGWPEVHIVPQKELKRDS